nr:internal transcribed spacer 2 and 28S ribosomal RNA gene protein; partial sequence [Biomphalaria glabrata]
MPALPRWMGLAIRDGPMRHSQYGGKPITPAGSQFVKLSGERETDNPRCPCEFTYGNLVTTFTFSKRSSSSVFSANGAGACTPDRDQSEALTEPLNR